MLILSIRPYLLPFPQESKNPQIIKLRLQGQLFTYDCNAFSENIALLSRGKTAAWLHGVPIEKLLKYSEFLIFLQFSEVVALPVQDMLHTEILMCDGNTVIS